MGTIYSSDSWCVRRKPFADFTNLKQISSIKEVFCFIDVACIGRKANVDSFAKISYCWVYFDPLSYKLNDKLLQHLGFIFGRSMHEFPRYGHQNIKA